MGDASWGARRGVEDARVEDVIATVITGAPRTRTGSVMDSSAGVRPLMTGPTPDAGALPARVHLSALAQWRGSTGSALDVLGAGRLTDADCTGLRVRHFFPWQSRFVECTFHDVDVVVALGAMHNDVLGCSFSGSWEGNFSARRGRRRFRVEGNDFSGVRGVSFFSGVDWRVNRFDLGGAHLILTRRTAGSDVVRRLADRSPTLDVTAASLPGEGPIGFDQDWVLLARDIVNPDGWDELCAALLP
jgi:hypothetical protein